MLFIQEGTAYILEMWSLIVSHECILKRLKCMMMLASFKTVMITQCLMLQKSFMGSFSLTQSAGHDAEPALNLNMFFFKSCFLYSC